LPMHNYRTAASAVACHAQLPYCSLCSGLPCTTTVLQPLQWLAHAQLPYCSLCSGLPCTTTVLQPLQWLAHAQLPYCSLCSGLPMHNYRTAASAVACPCTTTRTERSNCTLSTPCPSNDASSVFPRMLLMDLLS